MKIFDISVNLTADTLSWPGEDGFEMASQENNQMKISRLKLGTHTGTHVDAPCHFDPTGHSIDIVDLGAFIGAALVCHFPNKSSISLDDLRSKNLAGVKRILLRTDNSALWLKKQFCKNYVGLELEAARYLVHCGIKLIGIDYLSIEAFESVGNPVHKELLGHSITLLEGLNLFAIEEGRYTLMALPLKIPGADGSPVRAVLLQGEEEDYSCGDAPPGI